MYKILVYVDAENVTFSTFKPYWDEAIALNGFYEIIGKFYGSKDLLGGTVKQYLSLGLEYCETSALSSECHKNLADMKLITDCLHDVLHTYNTEVAQVYLLSKGKLIQSGDFSYLLYKGQLMAFKYSGKSMNIVIPDKVGNVAVTAVYRGLLHKTVFNNHKVRGIKRYFSDDVEELSVESILECYRGVRSIQLPKYLKSVPDLFGGCQRLKSVVIPASVKIISPDLIKHSRISELYFDGEVPQNLKFLRKKNCTIYCRQEYKAWYNQALRGR